MANVFTLRTVGCLFISFFLGVLVPFSGCHKSARVEPGNAKRVILVVKVGVSGSRGGSPGPLRAGAIFFYNDHSYAVDVYDDALKQRLVGALGRIIAEGRAARNDLSRYDKEIPITDRNFIYALIETAERKLNSGGERPHVYLSYR